MRTTLGTVIAVVIAVTQFVLPADASNLKMDVAVANPILLSGKAQTTYLKVGITGMEIADPSRRAPVNVAIVIDRSGSMQGEKIAKAREAAMLAVDRLGADDIVSVVAYNDTVSVLVPATKASDKAAIRAGIERLDAGGSTALFAGVGRGSEEVRKFLERKRANRIVLISDGLANVGPSSTSDLADLGVSLAKEGMSITTVGLGTGYNEDLMTKLAKVSDGNSYFAEGTSDLVRLFKAEFGDILSVVAQEITIKIECASDVRPVRVLGRDAEISGRYVKVHMNQMYGGQEKYVLLEVEMPATREGKTRPVADVTMTYSDMLTSSTAKLTGNVSVKFVDSPAMVNESVEKEVMVAAVTQIATERNILAVELRDEGKRDEAHEVLKMTAGYLEKKAEELKSPELKEYGRANADDATKLDDSSWGTRRKSMRSWQIYNETQQSAK